LACREPLAEASGQVTARPSRSPRLAAETLRSILEESFPHIAPSTSSLHTKQAKSILLLRCTYSSAQPLMSFHSRYVEREIESGADLAQPQHLTNLTNHLLQTLFLAYMEPGPIYPTGTVCPTQSLSSLFFFSCIHFWPPTYLLTVASSVDLDDGA